jgi:hypothetical protein
MPLLGRRVSEITAGATLVQVVMALEIPVKPPVALLSAVPAAPIE